MIQESLKMKADPLSVNPEISMRAVTLIGPQKIRVDRVKVPEPEADEVRIRLEGSGVCASNLASWEGMPWTQYPFEAGAMGHEGWGTVDAVGAKVTSIRVGDRVGALGYKSYAEYDIAKENAVVKLPASLSGKPFPGEALGCAMNIFRRSKIKGGDTVVIVGIGFLGALLTKLATNVGAKVIAVSRRPYSLDIAKKMGASEVVAMDDHYKIIEQVKALTFGKFADVVIEAVGKQWPLDLAGELTKTRGRLIIAGYHQDGPRQINLQLWNWRGLDVVNAHERDTEVYIDGMRAAVDAVVSGALDPTPLYTHVFGLEELDAALNATRDRPDGFMKALVKV